MKRLLYSLTAASLLAALAVAGNNAVVASDAANIGSCPE